MKPLFLCLLLIAGLSWQHLQGQCLTNGTFIGACSDSVGGCPTWTDACGAGWVRSHGTPQMKPNPGDAKQTHFNPFFAYMWSAGSGTAVGQNAPGEGMFTPFTFVAGHSYDLRILFSLYGSSGPANGTLYIFAANGLTQSALSCSQAPPTILSKQLIGSYSTTSDVSQNFLPPPFTANANYNQLWIYPGAGTSAQVNLLVTSVFLCPSCRNTVVYNTGTVPVSVSAGDITAGSTAGTGGSGIVTNQSTQATNLVAGNTVTLLPEFQAAISGGGTFIAQIVPCGQNNTVNSTADIYDTIAVNSRAILSSITANEVHPLSGQGNTLAAGDAAGTASAKFLVYPSVGSGRFTITGNSDDLAGADILVTDESGRAVFRSHNISNTTIPLDLGNLRNGMYFLQIRNNVKILTQKIIINK